MSAPSLRATQAFYYYRNLPAALQFYQETLGLELVADFGFAKMIQTSPSSFLTLMDLAYSQHAPDEPKTVTTAFVTPAVEAWYATLTARQVPMHRPFSPDPALAHEGFVAVDPEGYLLEFERFNPHLENEKLLPLLAAVNPIQAGPDRTLPITATVLWLYYAEMAKAQRFLGEQLGLPQVVDQGFAHIYAAAHSSFLGPVQAGKGLHPYTEKKLVTVSLITDALDDWLAHWQHYPDFQAQTAEMEEVKDRVRFLYGFDPEGHFVEFDQFLDAADNRDLWQRLSALP